jgi:hypothetical protein
MIPANIEKTGAPTTGNALPKNHESAAIAKQTNIPGSNFAIFPKLFVSLFSAISLSDFSLRLLPITRENARGVIPYSSHSIAGALRIATEKFDISERQKNGFATNSSNGMLCMLARLPQAIFQMGLKQPNA